MQRQLKAWLVRLFAMAALGAALTLTAQAQTGQAADQNTDPAAAAQGQQAGAAPEVDAEVEAEPDPNAVAQDGQVPTGTSPGRFIPREQLSQDLGASFPVDI
jgi:hypothetical protein